MTNGLVLNQLTIGQTVRYLNISFKGDPPMAPEMIAQNSANMHIIPATDAIGKKLWKAKRGDTVVMSGFLIQAESPDLFMPWRSSLVRTDNGPGACEIVWVTEFNARPRKP
jgi:hypothetical protein